MIQVYTGEGKGKTTAAVGLACRAVGHGMKVRMIQFLKGAMPSGELKVLESLGVNILRYSRTCKFDNIKDIRECETCRNCWIEPGNIRDSDWKIITEGWQKAQDSNGENWDLLILDEIINAISYGLIDEREVLLFLENSRADLVIVLTGGGASSALLDKADLVSEIRMIKHHYYAGIKARRGIEY